MRLVVDTNFLGSDEFGEFISGSANSAVIPDVAIVETLAGRDLPSIYKQLHSLTNHPDRAIILKATSDVSGLRPGKRRRGLQRRLIDKKETEGFGAWSAMLENAKKRRRKFTETAPRQM